MLDSWSSEAELRKAARPLALAVPQDGRRRECGTPGFREAAAPWPVSGEPVSGDSCGPAGASAQPPPAQAPTRRGLRSRSLAQAAAVSRTGEQEQAHSQRGKGIDRVFTFFGLMGQQMQPNKQQMHS
ncbi:hypothetical protein GUJ93_ZPchr0001g31111 [Zizania palustris]|uniref:Uncharacterized protein n=1 Tax=Zizania palustris TaxID=103762 RepID=A0A8J5RWB7_ZIZPA|nr:hypothetical protein GUJ93_ZPchr0001g31111 [Zizania palustris]